MKEMESTCVRVKEVYDWMETRTCKELVRRVLVPNSTSEAEECICIPYYVRNDSEDPSPIYTTVGLNAVESCYAVTHTCTGNCELTILVNGKEETSLASGDTHLAEKDHLESITILPDPYGQGCKGTLTLDISYSAGSPAREFQRRELPCYLTTAEGTILTSAGPDTFYWQIEKTSEQRSFPLRDGSRVLLNKISAAFRTHVTVDIYDRAGDVVTPCTFPVEIEETYYLCAPDGCKFEGYVTEFLPNAYVIPAEENGCVCLDIHLSLCISHRMKAFGDRTAAIRGALCSPREDIPLPCTPPPVPIC